jgi:sialate O-acetylesterase
MRKEDSMKKLLWPVAMAALLFTVAGQCADAPPTGASGGAGAVSGKPFLHPLFTAGMVIQRDLKVPIWGWTTPGGTVTVAMLDRRAGAVADAAGRWEAKVGPFKAGGPFTMTITGAETVTLTDVLVGDVWLCGGQSNMEFDTASALNGADEVAAADHPQIRLFKVPNLIAVQPQEVTTGGPWTPCSPTSVRNFSAVGYYFGRKLNQDLKIPIGLIQAASGGTPAEAWTSADALSALDDFKAPMAELAAHVEHYGKINGAQALIDWYQAEDPGTAKAWYRTDTDTSAWKEVTLPDAIEKIGLPDYDGIVWFQRTFEAPAAWAGKDLIVNLGGVDDFDTTWVNGTQVGNGEGWSNLRRYKVPGSSVVAGRNVIAVRMLDTGLGGGLVGPADKMSVHLESDPGTAVALAGSWRMQATTSYAQSGPLPTITDGNNRICTVLYNGVIAPLRPCAIKGVIWYQGEHNGGRGLQYRALLPALIKDWRAHFSGGEFAFHIVSLANWMTREEKPGNATWAELREAQALTARTVPHCGLALAIDLGDAQNIHPPNKQEVGRRLALSAEANTYGKEIEWSGPWYKAMTIEGDKIRVAFDHVGGGLLAKGGKLVGFSIAGEDRAFVWADAVITGDTVLVSSPAVTKPVAVRYAWANNPACNLYNKDDLPAVPFRTDAWTYPGQQ